MATFKADPLIQLSISFDAEKPSDRKVEGEFSEWLTKKSGFRSDLLRVGWGYVGQVPIVEAEKVVEWLKQHGVEHRQ